MQIINIIKDRIEEINKIIISLVENQTISLTEKNKLMKPLIDEKKVLEETLLKLQEIKATNYSGKCTK